MKKRLVIIIIPYTVLLIAILQGCYSKHVTGIQGNTENKRIHTSYDDSLLRMQRFPMLLPYNRLLDPAGTTVRFGHPDLENHSLDAILLPGKQLLLVEDRYGIIKPIYFSFYCRPRQPGLR